MGVRQVGLADIQQGAKVSRLRLLAPLRYLAIDHAEKLKYDIVVPLTVTVCLWAAYMLIHPRIPLFGESGLLKYTRDLLVMAVPFNIGALATVAMGAPGGEKLDRRPQGSEIYLYNKILTLRQFVCYLLGYISFIGLITLGGAVLASLLHDSVLQWTTGHNNIRFGVHAAGSLLLMYMLSSLTITVFWALYFLTDILNRPSA